MTPPQEYDARTPLRLLAALAAAGLLALMLTACQLPGSEDEADDRGGTAEEADVEDAMLEYAQCMREHGVPMEDPDPGERGLIINQEDVDPEIAQAAEEACGSILEDAIPEDGGREIPAEQKEALLATAQCMRDRGWDVPDPQFDGGRVTQRLDADPGFDPEDPAFQQDQEECVEESGVELPGQEGES